jgi:SAM-dependent methyltransferase
MINILDNLGSIWKRLYFFPHLRYTVLHKASRLFNSRSCELDFANAFLPRIKVIDIGASNSLYVYHLARLGYKVYALDQRDYQEPVRDNIIFLKHNILEPLFGYFNFFDVATLISSFEHFGRGEYGDVVNDNGYNVAAKNIIRMIKPGGIMIITVPLDYNFTLRKLKIIFKDMQLVRHHIDAVNVKAVFKKPVERCG